MAAYYKILGLDDHPADLKEAKRAYAKQLRKTRPDDDPEGFMKLREALNSAKHEIKWREDTAATHQNSSDKNNYDEPHEAPEIVYTENPKTLSDEIANAIIKNEAQATEEKAKDAQRSLAVETVEPIIEDPEPVIEDIVHSGDQILMSRLSKAFNDPFLKNNKLHWVEILNSVKDLSIDEYTDFDARFRGALINAYNDWIEDKKTEPKKRRPLPPIIENVIFDKMEWRFLQDAESHKANEINWLKAQFDLHNRDAPREQKKGEPMGEKPAQFVDDGIGLPKIIWRIIRTILIFVILIKVFNFFD